MKQKPVIKPYREGGGSLWILLIPLLILLGWSSPCECAQQDGDTIFLEWESTISIDTMGVGIDIAVCEEGTVFISDSSQSRIWEIKPGMDVARPNDVEIDHYVGPRSICCDRKGVIWVANPSMHEVLRCSNRANSLDCNQNPSISIIYPIDLVSGPGESIYVLDGERQAVLSLDSEGRQERVFHEYKIPSHFSARKIASLRDGKMMIIGEKIPHILLFNNGHFGELQLDQIKDCSATGIRSVTAAPELIIVLWDSSTPCLAGYYLNGTLKQRFYLAEPYLLRPTVLFATTDHLWIIDEGKQAVFKFKLRRASTGAEHSVLGEEYLALYQENEAVREFETAQKMGFDTWQNHLYWGQALFNQNRFNAALGHFLAAKGMQPSSARILNGLGETYERLGEVNKAIDAFTDSLRLKPRQAGTYHRLGMLWWKQGRIALALESLTSCLHVDPENSSCKLDISRINIKQGRYGTAIEHLKTIGNGPNVGRQARYLLGLAYLKQGDMMTAIAYLLRSAREGPFYYEALFALGQAYEASGQKTKAQQSYQHALAIRPNAIEAQKALSALKE